MSDYTPKNGKKPAERKGKKSPAEFPLVGNAFVSPDVVVREYKAGITKNASDAVRRYVYWAIVFYTKVAKKNGTFTMRERIIAERFGISTKTVNAALERSELFHREGTVGQRNRAWTLKTGVDVIYESDDATTGNGKPNSDELGEHCSPSQGKKTFLKMQDHDSSKCRINVDPIPQNAGRHNKEVPSLKEGLDKQNQTGGCSPPSRPRNKEENIARSVGQPIGNFNGSLVPRLFPEAPSSAPSSPPPSGSSGIAAAGGPRVVPIATPTAVPARPARRDKIGESMEAFLCRVNDGSICQACYRWGFVLTAHWLSVKAGADSTCQTVMAAIDGHTSSPDEIQHVKAMIEETLKWEPFTKPLGLALTDWRERMSPILAKVGEVPIKDQDFTGDEEGQVLAFLAGLHKENTRRDE